MAQIRTLYLVTPKIVHLWIVCGQPGAVFHHALKAVAVEQSEEYDIKKSRNPTEEPAMAQMKTQYLVVL